MPTRILRTLAIGALAFVAVCSDATTAPPRTAAEAAGEYVLASVTGRGAVSGEITLYADGNASRRAQYAPGAAAALVYQLGTYQLDSEGIAFALREAVSASTAVTWPVRGEWNGDGFSIRYGDPADGPDIVETYRRR